MRNQNQGEISHLTILNDVCVEIRKKLINTLHKNGDRPLEYYEDSLSFNIEFVPLDKTGNIDLVWYVYLNYHMSIQMIRKPVYGWDWCYDTWDEDNVSFEDHVKINIIESMLQCIPDELCNILKK